MSWHTSGVRRQNNLDFARFVLAVLVIYSHAYPLMEGTNAREPLYRLTRGQMTFGALAVNCFFILSGYLIAQSWMNARGVVDYFRRRVKRIYPGFVVATAVCVLVVVPMARQGGGWGMDWQMAGRAVKTAAMLHSYDRPDAFVRNPVPGSLNGAAWTVRHEFWCYAALAGLGLAGVLKKPAWVAGLFGVSIAVGIGCLVAGPEAGWVRVMGEWGEAMGTPARPRFASYFLAGTLFYLYRERIPYRWELAVAALGWLAAAMQWPGALAVVFPIAGAYVLFYLAFFPTERICRWGQRGDFSYGIYLYAFPIQQLLVRYGWAGTPLEMFAVATPLSVGAGMMSWYGVERWFLARGRREAAAPKAAVEAVGLAGGRDGRWRAVAELGSAAK